MNAEDEQLVKLFISALFYAAPRILFATLLIPVFHRSLFPGLMRFVVAVTLSLVLVPMIVEDLQNHASFLGGFTILIILKEAFIGAVIGLLIAIPFWVFEAIGFLIDNQRGASISATLNPATGNDSSPLGILFNQSFITFFFVSGGIVLFLQLIYDSYLLWPVLEWYPTLRAETVPLFLGRLDGLVSLALLLASPVLIAMFFSEMGLAFAGRFVPQLQVFFLAMPIKSAVALLMLILYIDLLFDYIQTDLESLIDLLGFLDTQWHRE